jgi:hypothetical protein
MRARARRVPQVRRGGGVFREGPPGAPARARGPRSGAAAAAGPEQRGARRMGEVGGGACPQKLRAGHPAPRCPPPAAACVRPRRTRECWADPAAAGGRAARRAAARRPRAAPPRRRARGTRRRCRQGAPPARARAAPTAGPPWPRPTGPGRARGPSVPHSGAGTREASISRAHRRPLPLPLPLGPGSAGRPPKTFACGCTPIPVPPPTRSLDPRPRLTATPCSTPAAPPGRPPRAGALSQAFQAASGPADLRRRHRRPRCPGQPASRPPPRRARPAPDAGLLEPR